MSVIVIGRMTVDPGNVEKLWAQRKSDFEAIAEAAKAAGAIHHRWGFGEGHVVIIDEWPDAGSFQKFFESYPKIPELMQAAGVQGPPEFDIVRAQDAPDQF
jgi:quinol monooxygenase YgiN